ncbi:hypothetical protein ZWY2020_027158 [Hordeum vulgare]|nr:hypothetical protein ZWY2020_027158 [Hordeum vulgare]
MRLASSSLVRADTVIQKDWRNGSDDRDKGKSVVEAETSRSPDLRNLDAYGSSILVTQGSNGWANGEASSTSVVEGYVAMGFPKEMVVTSIKDIGHSDEDALLELLLTYKALGDEDSLGNNSTSDYALHSVEDGDGVYFESSDGDDDAGDTEPTFGDYSDEDFLREMSEKDEKINSLVDMGFSEDEANMAITRCGVDGDLSILIDSISASRFAGNLDLSNHQVTNRFFDCFGGRKKARLVEERKKKRKRYGAARKRGYIHNLPIDNRAPLLPLPPKTIFEAFPRYKKWWPSWDRRTQFNCLLTSVASATVTERIQHALESTGNPPPPSVTERIMAECKRYNLVWVGKNKAAALEPKEIEYLLGFPKDHTRGVCDTNRYKSLGNTFHVDTVAYHLSVLKGMFPNGVNVLSLFTGIGGGEVALHRLGINMRTVVSVEIDKASKRIFRDWWDQTQTGTLIEIDDVKSLTNDEVAQFVTRLGGFDLVIGGSPCNNLAGCNRYTRNGLNGEKSVLFYEYVRILNVVKSAMARK